MFGPGSSAVRRIMKQLDVLGGNSILLLLHVLLSMQGEGKREEFQSSMWLWQMKLYAYSIYSTGIVSLTAVLMLQINFHFCMKITLRTSA
jgi:hypothetical protein